MTVDDMAPVWHTDRTAEHTRLLFPQPGRLLNVNQRVHWSVRSRVTRQWRTSAHQVALMLGTPRQRVHGVSWVRLIIPVPTRARRDPGNLYLLTKASVDGLVDAGVWPDDTHAFVETLEPRLIHIPRTKGDRPHHRTRHRPTNRRHAMRPPRPTQIPAARAIRQANDGTEATRG